MWVTVFGRVNHLSAEPDTQVYTQLEPASVQVGMSTWRKAGRVNTHVARYTSPYPWSRSVVLMSG